MCPDVWLMNQRPISVRLYHCSHGSNYLKAYFETFGGSSETLFINAHVLK